MARVVVLLGLLLPYLASGYGGALGLLPTPRVTSRQAYPCFSCPRVGASPSGRPGAAARVHGNGFHNGCPRRRAGLLMKASSGGAGQPPGERAPPALENRVSEGGGDAGTSPLERIGQAMSSLRPGSSTGPGDEGDENLSPLQRAGQALGVAWNFFAAAVSVTSVGMAAYSIWQLQHAPLTPGNVGSAVVNLLPLTGLGVLGVAQLAALAGRVTRVIIALPVMVSGAYVLATQMPQFLPKTDAAGAAGVFALLATPEVLEAVAVLTIAGGALLWVTNLFVGASKAAVGAATRRGEDDDK